MNEKRFGVSAEPLLLFVGLGYSARRELRVCPSFSRARGVGRVWAVGSVFGSDLVRVRRVRTRLGL